jgi:large subunit ribosomal protein L10e
MGDTRGTYAYKVSLLSDNHVQVRHNALEAARVAANKAMSDKLGDSGYVIQLCVYPHMVLRENRMIATAGADRLQEGMRHSFGKPSSRAARVKRNQPVITIRTNESALELAKEALRVSASKFPSSCRIVVESAEQKVGNAP